MPTRSRFLRTATICAAVGIAFVCGRGSVALGAEALEVVRTFTAKHCLACHGDKEPKAGLSLTKVGAAVDLATRRKAWEGAATMVGAGEMPPADQKQQPTADERTAFVAAVNQTFVDFERNAPPNPGRVTMRRLNRAEYNNTIRDLFYGLDVNAAEDFPSDDVGHGFDNIGDVLTMSPVLMERYLRAAEIVSERVIADNVPKTNTRGISMQYTQPASAKVPLSGSYRILSTKPGQTPVEGGPIFAQFVMNPFDDYRFRFGCYAERDAGDGGSAQEPIRAIAFVRGKQLAEPSSDEEIDRLWGPSVANLKPLKILGTFEVKARKAKETQSFEVLIPPTVGAEYVGVALERPGDGAAETRLFVKYLTLEGPLDSRPLSMRKMLDFAMDLPPAERTRAVLAKFAYRAFRRPPTPAELDRLVGVVAAAESAGEKWEAGLQLAVQVVLTSPKFLFRAELDDRPQGPQPQPLDDFQLASRLSYFLWSSMPDDELLDLAAKKQLRPNLESQVRRMLADPKSVSLVEEFAMQWLQLERLRTHQVDPALFPSFNEPLRQAMLKETQLFLGAVLREDRSILDLIDADFTFLNRPLADHYGIGDTAGNPKKLGSKQKKIPGGQQFRSASVWERVSLPPGSPRGGLLTQASVLTVSSNPTRTSPVKRGKWVLEQLLGAPPPPPPPNVPELEQQKDKLTGTLRQQMEQHRQNPACANCHAKMDPLGFAFENFNAIGGYRDDEDGKPVDASGTLPEGRSFNGPTELRAILKEYKSDFARCLAEKLLTFALGRGLEYYDRRAVDGIVAAAEKSDYKFSAICLAIAESDPFVRRRGSEAQASAADAEAATNDQGDKK